MKSEQEFIRTSAWDSSVFYAAVNAVRKTFINRHDYNPTTSLSYYDKLKLKGEYSAYHDTRTAFHDLTVQFKLHPIVKTVLDEHRPYDWQQLMFEWPHVSQSDPTRLAYTRDFRAMRDDRQTLTSIGKYLHRHWPDMPDHMVRNYVAQHTVDELYIVTDIKQMIVVLESGPRSCMQSEYGSIPFNSRDREKLFEWLENSSRSEPPWHKHPYFVYQPTHGWGMCAHKDTNGFYVGRALINTETMTFVRTYYANRDGYSGTDHVMEEWLKARGYTHQRHWADHKLALVEHPNGDGFMVPYIDGGVQCVDEDANCLYICEDGAYTCTNTDGTHSGSSRYGTCDDCGDAVHENDEYIYVGRYEDRLIGECCSGDYRSVRGSRGEYFVHVDDSDAVRTHSGAFRYYVDTENVPDDVVYVEYDECYAEYDDVVCINAGDYEGEYRFVDDDEVVEINGEWYVKDDGCWEDANGVWHTDDTESFIYEAGRYACDDGWQCDGTGLWYHDDVDFVEDDLGNKYHPSYPLRVNSDAEDDSIVILRTEVNVYLDKEPYDCLTSAEEAATV